VLFKKLQFPNSAQGRILRGAGGLQPPYNWCINENMMRVREKKRWRKKEKIERERKKKRPAPFNHVLHPPLASGCFGLKFSSTAVI